MRDKEFDLIRFIKDLNLRRIRYMLIGGQAAIHYGVPVLTFDVDLWVHTGDRKKTLRYLEEEDFEIDSSSPDKAPILKAYYGGERIDIFFAGMFVNREGKRIVFDACFKKAVIKKEPEGDFFVRLCPLEELVKLKKMRRPNPKDREQIRYLRELLNHETKPR